MSTEKHLTRANTYANYVKSPQFLLATVNIIVAVRQYILLLKH